MIIKFLGAAGTVTGSNFLIQTTDRKILIDCGMFQGNDEMEKMNKNDFVFNPTEIDFMFLTHAHIDHCGRIPKLVKEGFRNDIYCTYATKDLCGVMLLDSAGIMEGDAEWQNKKLIRQGKKPVEPLYTIEDAKESLKYLKGCHYGEMIKIDDYVTVRFRDAGHILGSAILEIWIKENGKTKKFVFSGDLGMPDRPILRDPEYIDDADYLVVESTYGDRTHQPLEKSSRELIEIINRTAEAGGTTVIPSFAVGRTQELIYQLNDYYENPETPEHLKLPIYVDSPMALEATEVFTKNSDVFDEETKDKILSGDNPLSFKNLRFVRTVEESMALNKMKYPKVIISASGMANAGRVQHHLKHNLWDYKNAVVFVGYQAEGTLGRQILDGARRVNILGEPVEVKARVYDLQGFSAHADAPMLLNWISAFKVKPARIFIVHGEEEVMEHFSKSIQKTVSVKPTIAVLNKEYSLDQGVEQVEETDRNIDPAKLKGDIEKQLSDIEEQYKAIVSKKEKLYDDKYLKRNYSSLKNKTLDLQRELMNLNLMLGD